MNKNKIPRVLVIAGSDSSGGAGIQADIKTLTAFKVFSMTAITAITAQNTNGVSSVESISLDLIKKQIEDCISDIGVDAIKIGMVNKGEIFDLIFEALKKYQIIEKNIPIICPKSAIKTLEKLGFSSIKVLNPSEKVSQNNLHFEATAGAQVPQIENGYIVKDDESNGFYIEPHGYLDERLKNQDLDAVITPTKNLGLPIVGSFVKGAEVLPQLINTFNPKFILSSTVGGDAKYSGFLNKFIKVQDTNDILNCKLVNLESMQSITI